MLQILPGKTRLTRRFWRINGTGSWVSWGGLGRALHAALVAILCLRQDRRVCHPSSTSSGVGGRVVFGRVSWPLGKADPCNDTRSSSSERGLKNECGNDIQDEEADKQGTYPRARLHPSDAGTSTDPPPDLTEESWRLKGCTLAATEGS